MNSYPHLPPQEVATLTRAQREARVSLLIQESQAMLTQAIQRHVSADDRSLAATVVLFSGGNDSTVLAHLMRPRVTHAAHANTTIGIEATRQFVRDTCRNWQLPLLEFAAPRVTDRYEALVLEQGFPGPGHHYKMYQRLKERALEEVRRNLLTNPYKQRVVFLAGRRRTESARRSRVPTCERRGSTVWVSPLANWTKFDLNTYRLMHGSVPVNEVSNIIHMSGECLCGSFARRGEREEVEYWFAEFKELIADLEAKIKDREDIPLHRREWGWGAHSREAPPARRRLVGELCSSCDARYVDEELPLGLSK